MFTLETLNERRVGFYQDRPLMLLQNKHDIGKLIEYFQEEVQELNGKGQEGIFAQDEFREDYRQQEVSDIVIYALSIYDAFGIGPNFDRIRVLTAEISLENNIKPVSENKPLGAVTLFDDGLENGPKAIKYEFLKHQLKEAAAAVSDAKSATENEIVLEQIIATAFNIFYLIDVPAIKSIQEKIARNMLKYQANMFSLAYLQLASIDGQEVAADNFYDLKYDPEKLDSIFAASRAASVLNFDGPKDENGVRPLTGTNDFYGLYERLKSQS